jgi:hypothetical protein
MRVITVPGTLNMETGLIASYIGKKKDLEALSTGEIIGKSKPTPFIYHCHPEPSYVSAMTMWRNAKKLGG